MDLRNFIYALINILNQMSPYILLGFLLAGLMHVFIRPTTMSRHFAGRGWKPVIKAALLGIPLPLCSCGVLPAAVGMRRQGASKGAATSFLIATPQTGVDSIAATYALLGLPFAVIRPVAALLGSFIGGIAVDKATQNECKPDEAQSEQQLQNRECTATGECSDKSTSASAGIISKISEAIRYGFFDMVASVGKWLVIGLLVAAVITVIVPDSLFVGLARYPVVAMLVMVAVAIPMYVCATGSIPIALSLMLKGLTPGVGFVLLMAGPAANFASVMVLRKSLGARATAIYLLSVVFTAIAFGLIIDYILPHEWFLSIKNVSAGEHCHIESNWFATICSILLSLLLIASFIRSRIAARKLHNMNETNLSTSNSTDMQIVIKVNGMNCQHCRQTVEKIISQMPGVETVAADLSNGHVYINGDIQTLDISVIATAINSAGFEFVPTANE